MNTQIKKQNPQLLPQKSLAKGYDILSETNNEVISPIHRYDASITLLFSPEKDFKTSTFILINGSQPEVADNQGILWSQAFCHKDGSLFIDLGAKIF